MSLTRPLIRIVALVALTGFSAFVTCAETDSRQLVQLIEYISVDYPNAVESGRVINPEEYREMQEFSGLVVEAVSRLAPGRQTADFLAQAKQLADAVQNRDSADRIGEIATTLRGRLLEAYPVLNLPTAFLPEPQVQALYAETCAGCHGAAGQGNGPYAAALTPAPTDFTDRARAAEHSVMGLYETLSSGVEGTAMTSFANLSDIQRWSLAFYVGSLAFNSQSGQNAPLSATAGSVPLQALILYSPEALRTSHPGLSYNDIGLLRRNPSRLLSPEGPIDIARRRLAQSRAEYADGHYEAAHRLAISAYLDGFELVENTLHSHDPALMKRIESDMIALRELLNRQGEPDRVAQAVQKIDAQLAEAADLLESGTLGASTIFTASFLILLREGLEALLVVLALITVLIKSDRRDTLKYVHAGTLLAVAAGILTWFVSRYILTITGATREVTEGVASLVSAVVLFYIGFWMHRKTQVKEWKRFIYESVQRHLGRGSLFGIAALAFIAVYRELFETVLFYQALWTQVPGGQVHALLAGLIAGIVALAALSWLMVRYSLKLPLKQFFSLTVYLLLALSFVLTGKAIAALQEAGWIAATAFPLPIEFDWLGIYPTWQGIVAQTVVLLLALSTTLIYDAIVQHKKLVPGV